MAAPAETGMDKAAMKQMLARSKKEPVNCAVALGKTQALLMLDKIKQPKALEKDLAKKFPDAKNPRWGTAFVDVEAAPKLVVFTLNKAAPGLAPKLKKALKGTGFSQIEIRLEDGSVAEAAGDEDEDEDDADMPAAPNSADPDLADSDGADSSGADSNGADLNAADLNADAAPDDGAPAPPAAPDVGALTRLLTGHVKRMIPLVAADPSRGATLKDLATQAQTELKAGRLDQATQAMARLQQALDAPAPPGAPPAAPGAAPAAPDAPPAPPAPALAGAPALWHGTIAHVTGGIGKLKDTIRQEFAGESPEVMADIERNLARMDQVTTRFDTKLADAFHNAQSAKDDAARKAELGRAKAMLAEHIKYVASEPLIALIDQNPFGVTADLKKTLIANLTQLAGAVR